MGKLDDVIHVTDAGWAGDPKTRCSTSGGVLAIGPCFTVRLWSLTQATVSLSSAESEAKTITKGCVEALYVKHLLEHQTARPFKIKFGRTAAARQGHHTTYLTRAQSKTCGGVDDVDSTVGKDRSHLAEQARYDGKRGMMTKHVPRRVLGKLAGTMGYTFLGEETPKVSGVREHQTELLEPENGSC